VETSVFGSEKGRIRLSSATQVVLMKGKQKQSLERREMDRGDEFVVELLYSENGEDEAE
jgi:hypothetical protein